jgi:hypothetical protein
MIAYIVVSWVLTPCRLVSRYQYFGGTCLYIRVFSIPIGSDRVLFPRFLPRVRGAIILAPGPMVRISVGTPIILTEILGGFP